ncbi:DUF551 domain-containing protein [Pseudocitrobacter faecalis]|uniref:Uncharacterized protein DUF551 n=1 Tax=Pseudocitrobacter faecalis TaxID=1398493 RepID=A0ABX9G0A8_9ENTR|nr:uncharacterized protein DUF551 [Pseudocitrobacter faecalis]
MTTPITKEQLQRIIESADDVISAQAGTNEDVHPESDDMIRLWDYLNDVVAPPEVVKQLAEYALAAMDAEPVADVVAWHKEGEERTCDIRLRRFDVAPGPLFAVAQPMVTADADDNFYSWFGREWHEHYQQNQYTTAAKQMLGVMAESAWKASRAAMLQDGNSPVIPDGWVACSERMPEAGDDMIVFTDEIVMSGVSYSKKKGFYIQALEYDDDEPVDNVTHWMPLPAAPQQEGK